MLISVVQEEAKDVLGVTSRKTGKKEETWWWYEAVQFVRKKKKERHLNRYEETIKAFKMANMATKLVVAKVKRYRAGCRDLNNSWERKDGQQK